MPAPREVAAAAWSEQLPHLLWRAQQSVQRLLNERLEGIGVSINQLGLAGRLDENGALSAADLARAHHITPQSVTTAMLALERVGWIVRRPHPVHKRVVLLELTELGSAGVAEGRRVVKDVDGMISRTIGPEAAEVFAENLRMLSAIIDGPDVPAGRMWPEPPH
ncbi:MarR family winged helix-turn-helix transcriptional regulator [Embleya hyalina]|uniref:MarR family transcriptional regulator n=1 Tax=Embleya hyalina TaxID=516124 RepID=A0A401YIG2_9ACTN|nr:MarR family transcriptional regulator [Embleya hyalina]GCD94381.1 MarR family transcriptional regulator [Embleya hyalina]